MRERFAHEQGQLARVRFDQWDAYLRAAIRASSKAAQAARHRLIARDITAAEFHKIRARQDKSLDWRLSKLEREFFK